MNTLFEVLIRLKEFISENPSGALTVTIATGANVSLILGLLLFVSHSLQ